MLKTSSNTSSWRGRSVFVTGATGFLGSWLTKALLERQANVVVLVRDRLPHSLYQHLALQTYVTEITGELENRDLLERIFNEYEIDTCFHLGAQTLVTTATRNPLSTFQSNLQGTWNVLEAARRSPLIKAIVVASTDKAYGDAARLPYRETTPLAGQYPYDVSKVCVDLLSQSYFHTYKLPISIARCGNLYGGGDGNYDRLIPGTIRSLLRGERPLIRSNGLLRRDYLYIDDAVNAYLMLAQVTRLKRFHGEAFNFASGRSATVLEVVDKLRELSGRSTLKPRILNQARLEIREQRLSSDKAKQKLTWNPQVSLNDGLAQTWRWYQENKSDLEATSL